MQLELTLDEARVLTIAAEYIVTHNTVSQLLYVRDEGDMTTMAGVAGRLRALYEMEHRK
jgi:hypothetical protein